MAMNRNGEAARGMTLRDVTFSSLYREHHPRVLAYFLRRFDRDAAIDCAADVFSVAWRRFEDIPDGEEAIRWIYGICRNVWRNQERSHRRLGRLRARLALQPLERPVQPDAVAVRRSEEQLVITALSRLRPQDREILRLATWEELPHADIAEILGCSRHAVDQRVQRATARLRREFDKASLLKGLDHEQ